MLSGSKEYDRELIFNKTYLSFVRTEWCLISFIGVRLTRILLHIIWNVFESRYPIMGNAEEVFPFNSFRCTSRLEQRVLLSCATCLQQQLLVERLLLNKADVKKTTAGIKCDSIFEISL